MCWIWPLLGTGVGALLGYFLGSSINSARVKTLSEENTQLSLKVSELAKELNSLSHYRDKLSNVKEVVQEFVSKNK